MLKRLLLVLFLVFLSCPAWALELYGTIRRNSDGSWAVLDNATHAPLNITAVSVQNPTLTTGTVTVSFPLSTKVGTFIVVPDETAAKSGIIAGASVGLDSAVISFAKGVNPIAPNAITNANANFWIYGKMWE